MKKDTIAAISTALSDSGIGIIRISGSDAIEVGNRIFQTPGGKHILKEVESHTIHYGFIYDENDCIDEVMISVMKGPRSFTAEDIVEINCHGGVLVMQRILSLVCDNGARLAEPGEFTKRAFLNGRIDLSRAEAVMDMIHSQNEMALKSSVNQLQGKLSKEIKDLRQDIIYEIAFIESALDDPEHISLDGYQDKLKEKIENILKRVDKLINSFQKGKIVKDGISTVILGKPNAGKSSLLNILVGEERAIVTDIAGTTRDVLQESVRLHGIHLNLIDTAGIRDTEDTVEKIGVERAKKYAQDADLILCVIDSSKPLDENDKEILSLLQNKNAIILLNKNDLDVVVTEEDIYGEVQQNNQKLEIIKTSTKEEFGIEELENKMKEMFLNGVIQSQDEIMITNLRHKEALQDAFSSLKLVKQSIEDDMPEDFYSIDLMSAYSSLGLIIGEAVEDDLVEEIFSKFCMGK